MDEDFGETAETDEKDTRVSFEEAKDLPCSVDQIRVTPDELQTRLLLIQREIKQTRKAGTFAEVLEKLQTAIDNLQELGVFAEVNGRVNPGLPVRMLYIHCTLCCFRDFCKEDCGTLHAKTLPELSRRLSR